MLTSSYGWLSSSTSSMRCLSILCSCLEKRLKSRTASGSNGAEDEINDGAETWDLFFDLHTLQLATNFFSELNQLGHGGFGPVYKVRYVNSGLIDCSFAFNIVGLCHVVVGCGN